MDTTAIIVINCVCTVLSVSISMFSTSSKYFKNSITKSDLKPIQDSLKDLEDKIDRQEHAQSDMRERMAVVEFQLGIKRKVSGGTI